MTDVLFVTNDLMFTSRANSAAERAGVTLSVVNRSPVAAAPESDPSEYEPSSSGPKLVILDLSTPGLDVAAFVAAWRSKENPPRIIAYGPHVHEARLAAAREAACDAVYTKGQFDTLLDAILSRAKTD